MNTKKILLFGVLPIGSALIMVLMYFSGVDLLRQIIAPNIPGIYANSERELGLLENLQNVTLLVMLIVIGIGFRRKTYWLEKCLLVGIGCATLFVLLEEMDYGLHYYELINGVKSEDAVRDRNFHNVEGRTPVIKRVVDTGLVLMFFVLPIALRNSRSPFVLYFLPDRYLIIPLLGSFLVSSIAHAFDDHGFAEGGVFGKNISEFREYVNYFIVMFYTSELALNRHWETSEHDETKLSIGPSDESEMS